MIHRSECNYAPHRTGSSMKPKLPRKDGMTLCFLKQEQEPIQRTASISQMGAFSVNFYWE